MEKEIIYIEEYKGVEYTASTKSDLKLQIENAKTSKNSSKKVYLEQIERIRKLPLIKTTGNLFERIDLTVFNVTYRFVGEVEEILSQKQSLFINYEHTDGDSETRKYSYRYYTKNGESYINSNNDPLIEIDDLRVKITGDKYTHQEAEYLKMRVDTIEEAIIKGNEYFDKFDFKKDIQLCIENFENLRKIRTEGYKKGYKTEIKEINDKIDVLNKSLFEYSFETTIGGRNGK